MYKFDIVCYIRPFINIDRVDLNSLVIPMWNDFAYYIEFTF